MSQQSRFKSFFKFFKDSQQYPANSTDEMTSSRQIYINIEPIKLAKELSNGKASHEDTFIPTVYPSNYVRTTKYTKLTFFPKNLLEQFQRAANLYFMFLICLQLIPEISTGIQAAILGTFSFLTILFMTMAKDGYEDFNRYKSDLELNNRTCKRISDWDNTNIFNQTKSTKEKNLYFNDTISETDLPLMKYSVSAQLEKNPSSTRIENHDSSNDWAEMLWKDVQVGDIIKLERDEAIPADMIILSTSEKGGVCFVETKNLDGETNLKTRLGLKTTAGANSAQHWRQLSGLINSEKPNSNLYSFNGSFQLLEPFERKANQTTQEPLSIQNILLRGCIVRNVEFVIGIVIYTGPDTKLILNSGVTLSKKSYIETIMNTQVMINFIMLFTMSVIVSVISGVRTASTETSFHYFGYFYNHELKNFTFAAIVGFFSSLILFQNIVPISLYLTVEVVKSVQAYFIHSDLDMYHEETGTPCVPNAWNLSDDLGQIEYLFSDKTGTLTQNVMEFKQCTIGGNVYGQYNPTSDFSSLSSISSTSNTASAPASALAPAMYDERDRLCNNQYRSGKLSFTDPRIYHDLRNLPTRAEQIRKFFTILAVCHSVLIDSHTEHEIKYNAESPDEAALVAAATNVGFTFLARTQDQVKVNVLGDIVHFKILNLLEFDSTRKRMSVLVQLTESNQIHLFCKGADSVIMERLAAGNESIQLQTRSHLKLFGKTGLRTLCVASRQISLSEYSKWNSKWNADFSGGLNGMNNLHVAQLCDAIERDLTLVGGTAIEDKLQVGVPGCITLLREAGIKLWVLTGDKLETAMNIAFSCNLITHVMSQVTIDADNLEEVGRQIRDALSRCLKGDSCFSFALIIDGFSLKYALDESLRSEFLVLGKNCEVVLCCRVSPLQKAQVVSMVKLGLKAMTLAIGDGANDVSMIQAAHIGVGIAGLEGYQAVMASDYVIAQFRYLSKLLLVHGRWCYLRVSHMILCFFYKNLLMTLTNFWFQFYNATSQTFLYEYVLVLMYNLVFTAFPIMILGSFDQDVQARVALVTPQLYRRGILHKEYNHLQFWLIVIDAAYQSCICFFAPFVMFNSGSFTMSGDSSNSLDGFGTVVAACVVVTSNLYVGLWAFSWNYLMFAVISCSILFFFVAILFLSHLIPTLSSIDTLLFTTFNFWIVLCFAVTASLLPRLIARYIHVLFTPNDSDIIREQVLVFTHYISRQSRRLKQLRRRYRDSDEQASLMGCLFPSKANVYTGYAFSTEESLPLSRSLRESILKCHVEATSASTEHAASLASILDVSPENFNVPDSNIVKTSSDSEKSKTSFDSEHQFLPLN